MPPLVVCELPYEIDTRLLLYRIALCRVSVFLFIKIVIIYPFYLIIYAYGSLKDPYLALFLLAYS